MTTVHYLDSDYANMPRAATGRLGVKLAGPYGCEKCGVGPDQPHGECDEKRLLVGDIEVRPADVWTIHEVCDHADQRSPAARDNFHRKYGYYPEERFR